MTTKSLVSDIMKYSKLIPLIFLLFFLSGLAQDKYEREYRIRKNQFPENALGFLESYLVGAKRIRFYKEVDSAKISFEAKFKKDRLFYSIGFDGDGNLAAVEILIKEVDIPQESLVAMEAYLESNFRKYRIRKIQQQYPLSAFGSAERTMEMAFQNLLDPNINYELIVAGKIDGNLQDYEILFDANGKFIRLKKSLPANYDHVLY